MPRGRWVDGRIAPDRYAAWARETAQATGASFLDLHGIIGRHYETLGPERVTALFADAGTHTTPEGAALSASMVAAAVRALGGPLASFLSARRPVPR